MSRRRWKRLLVWALAIVAIVLLWIVGSSLVQRWYQRGPAVQVQASAEQIERGRYLVAAADCAACHTADGGAPFAGGVPLASPFGVIHGTNITPDTQTGIGRYSADEFFHAITRGEARDGHQLYPAMPYVSYKTLARADSDAIYAYLMTRPAVQQENRANGVGFPFNIRTGIHAWNLLFAGADAQPASQGSSAAWKRGEYLVETLGHCGECHSPRGWLGQVDRDRPLTGNDRLGRYAAPDLTPTGLAARGWDRVSLRAYLATGTAAPAVASDEMLKVVNLSTSRLDGKDLDAIATYLSGDSPRPATALARPTAAAAPSPAQDGYFALCAGCHGRDGQGVPHVAPALHGNSSLRDANPHNLIVAILDGLPEHDLPGLERMQEMPGFGDQLDNAQVAELAAWLRARYGGRDEPVPADRVRALRAATPESGHR
ncbi:cytochrome c [Lysobacter antibioticus]|uniref:Cytochrome c family protein n=1 Tax=Lysobacter antibioticus TaxID=84531 RepID=A0A0S2F810_LYSAN|nr:cytochrome c [Lysobacter antibioticus]ALN79666.1 cytochrome c family protein [Lysobacter antibioticus]